MDRLNDIEMLDVQLRNGVSFHRGETIFGIDREVGGIVLQLSPITVLKDMQQSLYNMEDATSFLLPTNNGTMEGHHMADTSGDINLGVRALFCRGGGGVLKEYDFLQP